MEMWSCLLGFLVCTPVVVIGTCTVSQKPHAITSVGVNSSTEIQCSTTSFPGPKGLSLRARFHGNIDIVYLSLQNGTVQQQTENKNYRGRVDVVPANPEHHHGCSITLRLSRLAVEDTDQYICHWSYSTGSDKFDSSGTILIVRGPRRAHSCGSHTENTPHVDNFILAVLSVTSFSVILLIIFIGTLLWRCRGG